MSHIATPLTADRPSFPPYGKESNAWDRAFWILLATTTLLRLIYARTLPLTGDEAYLWEWGRHPSLSYYDHPPMAGWILWLMTSVLGNTVLAIRITGVGIISAVVLITHRLAWRISGSARFACLAGLLLMGIPLVEIGGVLITPDTPLIGAGALGGYFFYLAAEEGDRRAWWGLGLCFGAALLSKFLGAALPAACFGFLILSKHHRPLLREPGPYISLALAAVSLVPVIVWNASNEWATFVYTFSARHSGAGAGLGNTADYLLGQSLGLSPLVLLFAFPALAGGFIGLRGNRMTRWALPAFLALVPYGGLLLVSILTKVGAHWPAAGLPFLALTVTAYLLRKGPLSSGYVAAAASAWVLTALLFLIPVIPRLLPDDWEYPLRSTKVKTAQLRKLTISPSDSGKRISAVLEEMKADNATFVFTRSYALSSLVAFYTPGHPEVTVLGGGSSHGRNHFLWFEPEDYIGHDGVFVSYRDFSREREFLLARFDRVEPVPDTAGEDDGLRLTVVRCFGYSGKR